MSQLIDGIASSAMAYILFWKWQYKPNYSFTSTDLSTLKINLNMKIDIATHSAKTWRLSSKSLNAQSWNNEYVTF